jgi:rubrerythrin
MSIVESLKKLVDPVAARVAEEQRRKQREQPTRDDAGPPPANYACRICGYRGSEPEFCPTCLAGTMRPASRPPREG